MQIFDFYICMITPLCIEGQYTLHIMTSINQTETQTVRILEIR